MKNLSFHQENSLNFKKWLEYCTERQFRKGFRVKICKLHFLRKEPVQHILGSAGLDIRFKYVLFSVRAPINIAKLYMKKMLPDNRK